MSIAIYATAILLNLVSIGYALYNLWVHENAFTKSVEAVCHVCYAALTVSVLLNGLIVYRLLTMISSYMTHFENSAVWLAVGALTATVQYFVGYICKGLDHDKQRFSRFHHVPKR